MRVFTILKLSLVNYLLVLVFCVASFFLYEALMMHPYRHIFGILAQTEIDARFLFSFLIGAFVIYKLVSSELKTNGKFCVGLCLMLLTITISATFIADPVKYQEKFAIKATSDFLNRYPDTDEAREIRGYLETKNFEAIDKFDYLRTFYIDNTISVATYVVTYNTPEIEAAYRAAISDGYINVPEKNKIDYLVEAEILRRIKNL